MEIEKLKIGDWVYQYQSSIMSKNHPYREYSFFQIVGETPKQWKLGCRNIRKSDLKVIGSIYPWECMKIMDEQAWNMKKIQDSERESQ